MLLVLVVVYRQLVRSWRWRRRWRSVQRIGLLLVMVMMLLLLLLLVLVLLLLLRMVDIMRVEVLKLGHCLLWVQRAVGRLVQRVKCAWVLLQ